ncbi:cystatin domain-containing protein [Phthorimaea operculella]|nr:cystatin domain-containing protein [Phthorimaea operculella]
MSLITGSETPLVWRHVPGEWNPADCASRGCRAPDLVSHPLWWGPQWLTESPQEWPFNECRAPLGPPDRGLRVNVGQLVPKPNPAFLLERYSSLDKLLGVTGWIKRFVNNCRKPQAERNFAPVLSPAERNAALCSLVRVVQAEHFEEESSSGEQFIAVPRDRPAPCIGCATVVDPAAAGVRELATLGVSQLDRHEPDTRHALNDVLLVERQVQVVGGVRYIMTLTIDYDNCTTNESDDCNFQKICRISILEKPWQKLPDGSKFRAIVSNNCTDEWLFGENGLYEPNFNNQSNDIVNPTSEYDPSGGGDDIVKAIHNIEVQAQPALEKTLTENQIKELEEQIIPNVDQSTENNNNVVSKPTQIDIAEVKSTNLEAAKPIEHIPSQQTEQNNIEVKLTEDKQKAIDELMNFFDFAGLEDKAVHDEVVRMKRDYGSDLKMLNVAENYREMKTKLKNAQFINKLASVMVNHINEIDIEARTRVLKEVLSAEEETEDDQRYFYIQARVSLPCDKPECKNKEVHICDGIVDGSGDQPSVLYTLCNSEQRNNVNELKDIPKNDPILSRFLKRALTKIDVESKSPYALKIRNILSASTQRVSGTLTKITVEIEYTECFKSVPLFKRKNCKAFENLGYKVCDIEVVERHWLKESKLTYTCTDRPVDETFVSDPKQLNVDDPKILEIVHEALQNLEVKSNRNNKQKLIEVKSVSTKQVAGILTNIVFTVGYTTCPSEFKDDVNACELLENEPLRICSVEVWERAWLDDGKQLNISCEEITINDGSKIPTKLSTNKRSIHTTERKVAKDPSEYSKLADDSLTNYIATYGINQHYKVVKIDKENVSDDLTTIDFEAAPTNCTAKNGYPTSSPCNVQDSKETLSCHAEVLSKPQLNSRMMKVNCQVNAKEFRKKREVFVGGATTQDPSKPKYIEIAKKSLIKYVRLKRKSKYHQVVKIEEVNTQVVSGFITRIKFLASPTNCDVDRRGKPKGNLELCVIDDSSAVLSCSAEVYQPPSMRKEEIDVSCHPDQSRVKRDASSGKSDQKRLLGGLKEKDVSDPMYKQLAEESLAKYVSSIKSTEEHKIIEIKKVRTQVVAGLKTFIDFSVQNPANVFECHSKIWEQPWLNKKEIDVKCNPTVSRQKRQVSGLPSDRDPKDPKYRQLAKQSLNKFAFSTFMIAKGTIVKIEKVQTQVVAAGRRTLIDFKVKVPGEVFGCHSEILEQPWLNHKQYIDVNCNPTVAENFVTSRKKRQVPGGTSHKDPKDPQYTQLAEESLAKYVSSVGSTDEHKIIEIKKVQTQVVSGLKTIIDFTVQGPSDVRECHSEVWVQSWLNRKEINVNCNPKDSRQKRQVPGGTSDKDPKDPKYTKVAEESLAKYVSTIGSSDEHKIIEIKKVRTQVVAGLKTFIDFTVQSPANVFDCNSEIWEQPWLNKKEIDVKCNPTVSRKRRQIPGSPVDKDVSNPEFKQLAEESLAKYVSNIGSSDPHKIIEIKKVQTQVVSGSNTIIDFTVQGPSGVLECHSEVWEQSWLNKKEINVNCNPKDSRQKRQVPGGTSDKDPKDPKYTKLAEESLAKYVSSVGSTDEHKIIEIKKVQTQVVSGSNTIIDFTVQGPSDVLECHSEVWEQSWLNRKEINVNCNPKDSRQKRQVPGGTSDKDPKDPKYTKLAEESLTKYVSTIGSSDEHKIIEIKKVRTQVVAGLKTFIDFTVQSPANVLECNSEIWEQPWLNKKEIDVKCNPTVSRKRRQIPGAPVDKDVSNPEFKQLAEESLAKYVSSTGSSDPHKIIEIKKVQTQVVSGSKTIIDFTVQGPSDVLECHSEVWEQSWLNKKEINVKCNPKDSRQKRQVPGGTSDKDPKDPKYTKLAEESLAKYVSTIGSSDEHKIIEIKKVRTQVVAGLKTFIDFTVQSPANVFECNSEIWEQPWLNKKEIDVKCNPTVSRKRRQIPGAPVDKDVSNPEFKQLAEESLAKYVSNIGSSDPHKIIEIKKVQTQVVSGSNTIIDFTVQGPSDVLECHSEVWEQSWLNKKEINVNCNPKDSRQKRQVPGGTSDKDPKDPKYTKLAEESLAKYVSSVGSTDEHKIIEIKKVQTQVVSGSNTIIDFTVQGPSDVLECHSEVWEQSWLNKKDITVKCNPKDSRRKRQVPGGTSDKDPKDPKYTKLAEESLAKYVSTIGSSDEHKIIKIKKVRTQVVAGLKTFIDFTVQSPANVFDCYSEIWEQPWLNKKEIDVKCNPTVSRKRRQIPGAPVDKDVSNPEFKQLAEESLAKYVSSTGSSDPHKIIEIKKVQTQVVSGSKTIIDFTVQGPSDVLECHSEVWEQSWLNKKEINVKCNPKDSRQKRQVKGGTSAKDPKDPKYTKLAEESLAKYVSTIGSSDEHKIIEIKKVRTQVVAGLKTFIDFTVQSPTNVLECNSEIWEQPWLNKKEIDVKCNFTVSRKRRQIPGAPVDKDVSNPEFKQLAEESLAKYVSTTGSSDPHKIIEIKKVQTQVVSGSNTIIDFTVQGPSDVLECHSEVWEQSWLNRKEINVKCSPKDSRQKRQVPGGTSDKDPKDPKYTKLAEESLAKYVSTIGSSDEHKIIEIKKVRTQVVAGLKTFIDFTVQSPANVFECNSEIWEQPWLNKKEIDVKCNPTVSRKRRQIPGAPVDKDVSSPEFKQLAEESLAKYVSNIGSSDPHKIIEIKKVQTQVVSGSNTIIDFTVQGPSDVLECHSEIWEQSWLNRKEINVKCYAKDSRQKRQVLGGTSDKDPKDPKYTKLAEESLAKYVSTIGSSDEHKIIEIKKVRTQVVAGLKTFIDFTVQGPSDVLVCHSVVWEQSWLNKKDITVNCSPLQSRQRREVQLLSAVRNINRLNSVHSAGRKSGGQKIEDPTDPKYAALATEALRRFEKLKKKIWDRPWIKSKKITVFCNNENDDEETDSVENKRSKRSLNNKSEETPTPVEVVNENIEEKTMPAEKSSKKMENIYLQKEKFYNSKHYLKAAEAALREYEKRSKSDIVYKVVKIYYVNEEDDVGVRARLDFTASPTNCVKTNHTNIDSCEVLEPKELMSCHADIRLTMMLNNNMINNIDVKCKQRKNKKVHRYLDKARNKRQMPLDETVEDDLMYYYADRVMSQLNTRFAGDNLFKLITVHDIRRTVHMKTPLVRMYLEVGKTLCLRNDPDVELSTCNEIDGSTHILCYARLWPSIYDDIVLERTEAVCEDELRKFTPLAGFHTDDLLAASLFVLNRDGANPNFMRSIGDPYLIPTLDSNKPFRLSFIAVETNCTKEYAAALDTYTRAIAHQCQPNIQETAKQCHSQIYMAPNSRTLRYVNVSCTGNIKSRTRRSISLNPKNITREDITIQKYVQEALQQLEMVSVVRYKQRVLVINRYSTKTAASKQTTIDFDVGYTNCLKYEWVDNITSCEFLEHLPRRHCVAVVTERLWSDNGRQTEVHCDDDETPLEANMELETAQSATTLAKEALKRIEYKYPHPRRQIVVRIFSLEKQMVAGVHYRMKMEVGYSTCMALSEEEDCKLDPLMEQRKFCRVNVWVRSWTNHPPSYRVTCDYQDGAVSEIFHQVQAQELFSHFIARHKPSYLDDHEEMQKRFAIFTQNVKKIHELNVYEMGTARYAVTQYADLTTEEFRKKYLGLDVSLRDENQVPMPEAVIPDVDLPDSFDWREKDAVTEVKNQGGCGSCWAFSVTGNIEGQWKIRSGKLVSLSEQELVDCDKLDNGCNGGLPDNAYRAIEQLGGLETETDYPYEAEDDKCAFNKTLSRVQISGAVNISSNETNMAKWLVKNGPISIGINANAMQFYVGGISHPWKMLCNPSNLDHGVLIVGYGIKNYPLFNKKLPYWIVKNSWGPGWGEQGYYRVYRGDGTCGVNQMASSAVI